MSSIVIGNFDGVHSGHRELLAQAKAARLDEPLVAVTFWPHPAAVVHPPAPLLLLPLSARISRLRAAGADRVEVIEFTEDFARLTPEEFVTEVLVPLFPTLVVVGENFHFGYRAVGNVETLRQLGAGRFEVLALSLVQYGVEDNCSTLIRQAVLAGDVVKAAKLLGRSCCFSGEVVHGDHRGRTLGFPTANLLVPAELICPADGVYAGWLNVLGQRHPAAISVGNNPTFDPNLPRRVEAYALDRDDLELYGAQAAVEFVARIRGMVKFASVVELVAQMSDDVRRCRELLGAAPQPTVG